MGECRTCELLAARDSGNVPPRERVLRTPCWDVVHAYGTSAEGWMVLVVRRHLTSVAELSDDEALELGPLIKRVSGALHDVVGCVKTYVALFAEDPLHPHVHIHIVPRHADQPDDQRGPRVFSQLGLSGGACVSDARMDEISLALGERLAG